MNNVKHAVADARSEVECLAAPLRKDAVNRLDMAESKVNNMNIIAHAGSVRCVVIIAENIEIFALSDCHLSDIRHKVVRNTVGVFADNAAFMRSDRIEISQKAD